MLLKITFFYNYVLWTSLIFISVFLINKDVLVKDINFIRKDISIYFQIKKIWFFVVLSVFISIIMSHYIKKTILFFPSLSVSWIYYDLSRELADSGKFLKYFIQYGEALPRAYSYLSFDVFNATLMKMTGLSNLLFMYLAALINLFLCVVFVFSLARRYFSVTSSLLLVIFLTSYPVSYGLAPRVWSYYWPEVLGFALLVSWLHLNLWGLKNRDFLIATLNIIFISFIYMVHPVAFAVLMMLLVIIAMVIICFDYKKILNLFAVYYGLTLLVSIVFAFMLPSFLTGSNDLVEYVRGACQVGVGGSDPTLLYLSFFFQGLPATSPTFNDYFHWGRGASYYQWPLALITVSILALSMSFYSKLSLLKKQILVIFLCFLLGCFFIGFLYYFYYDFFTLKRAGFYRFIPYTLISIAVLLVIFLEYLGDKIALLGATHFVNFNKRISISSLCSIGAIVLALVLFVSPSIANVIKQYNYLFEKRYSNFYAYNTFQWIRDNTEENDLILTSYVSTGSFRSLTGRKSFLDGAVAPGVKYKGALPDPNKNFVESIEYFKTGDYSILERNKIDYLFVAADPHVFFGLRSYLTPEFLDTVDDFDYLVLVNSSELFDFYRVIGDIGSLIQEYKTQVKKFPDNSLNYLILGRLYNKLSQSGQAEMYYSKAIEVEPNNANSYVELGSFYLDHNLPGKAENIFYQVVDSFSYNFSMLQKIVTIYYVEGTGDKDSDLFNKIITSLEQIKEKSESSKIYFKLAKLFQQLGNDDKAILTYQKIINRWPDQISAHAQLALIYESQERYEKAITEYRLVLSEFPNNIGIHYSLGILYKNVGQRANAFVQLQKASSLSPEQPMYHRSLAELYREDGQLVKAIQEYEQAVALLPDSWYYRQFLAELYVQTHQIDKAIAQYAKLIELRPGFGMYPRLLGDLYCQVGKYEDALAMYQAALSLEPEKAYYHSLVSKVYMDMGEPEKALKYAEEAVRLNPAKPAYKNLLLQLNKKIKMGR